MSNLIDILADAGKQAEALIHTNDGLLLRNQELMEEIQQLKANQNKPPVDPSDYEVVPVSQTIDPSGKRFDRKRFVAVKGFRGEMIRAGSKEAWITNCIADHEDKYSRREEGYQNQTTFIHAPGGSAPIHSENNTAVEFALDNLLDLRNNGSTSKNDNATICRMYGAILPNGAENIEIDGLRMTDSVHEHAIRAFGFRNILLKNCTLQNLDKQDQGEPWNIAKGCVTVQHGQGAKSINMRSNRGDQGYSPLQGQPGNPDEMLYDVLVEDPTCSNGSKFFIRHGTVRADIVGGTFGRGIEVQGYDKDLPDKFKRPSSDISFRGITYVKPENKGVACMDIWPGTKNVTVERLVIDVAKGGEWQPIGWGSYVLAFSRKSLQIEHIDLPAWMNDDNMPVAKEYLHGTTDDQIKWSQATMGYARFVTVGDLKKIANVSFH